MKHFLIFVLSLFGNIVFAFGQTPAPATLKAECFSNASYKNNSVSTFKEELSLKFDVTKITVGKTLVKVLFSHTEKIKSESSLIQINDTVAFRISIGRVVEYKAKKYLYKANMFLKRNGCWDAATPVGYWHEFVPGVIVSGLGFGREGTTNYLAFHGGLIVE